jgi:hypothetical protein
MARGGRREGRGQDPARQDGGPAPAVRERLARGAIDATPHIRRWLGEMDAVERAARRLAARDRPLTFGHGTAPVEFLDVTVQDGSGHQVACAFLPLPMALELLERIADLTEQHGYGATNRTWRTKYPRAWREVKERPDAGRP